MAARKQFNVRLSDLTLTQITRLSQRFGMSEREVVALAVDRLMQTEESKRGALLGMDRPATEMEMAGVLK